MFHYLIKFIYDYFTIITTLLNYYHLNSSNMNFIKITINYYCQNHFSNYYIKHFSFA